MFEIVENISYIDSMKETKYAGYFVNESGELFSKKQNSLKKLNPSIDNNNGYIKTSLIVDGVYHNVRLHRLVAETFIPNPENKPMVNHKNGDKTDNRVENLEWVTAAENIEHARNVLGVLKKRSHKDIEEMVYMRNLGYTLKAIGDRFNMTPQSVRGHIINYNKKI